MRLKTIYKTSLLVGGLFLYTCFILYLYAGSKDRPSDALLGKMAIVREKGLVALEMEWLNHVAAGDKTVQQISGNKNRLVVNNVTHVREIYNDLKFDNPPGGVWKQGFPIQCEREMWSKKPLEVYIVPHSHHDPGWIMTIEEYFIAKTKPCLDSTLMTLLRRPEARFTYAEVVFFSMWFKDLSSLKKQQVKSLLENGRLEISTGGWVMTDEAAAHYHGMIDQLIEGHHWLIQTFGYLPNTSWSIDPFGQSSSMAYFLNKMHLSGAVINRVHYEIKRYLAEAKALEFNWRQTWDLTGHSEVLTHLLPFYSYDIPHTCGPNPAVCCQFDFKRKHPFGCPWKIQPKPISPANVAERARMLGDQYCQKATLFNNSGIILVPLGDDFRYTTVEEWDKQLDNYGKLINYWNAHPEEGIRARFATVSDYFVALRRNLRVSSSPTPTSTNLPRLIGDLFTYADRNQDYWSGYFTSRPVQKQLVRVLESELRAAEILYTYARQYVSATSTHSTLLSTIDEFHPKLTEARRNVALFQHHDGITGTAKEHVVQNYHAKLLLALHNARIVSSVAVAILLLTFPSPDKISQPSSTEISRISLDRLLGLAIELKQSDTTVHHRVSSLEDTFSASELPEPQLLYSPSRDSTSHGLGTVCLFNPTFHRRTTSTVLTVQRDRTPLTALQTVFDPHKASFTNRTLLIQADRVAVKQSNSKLHLFVDRLRIGPVTVEPMAFTCIHVVANKSGLVDSSLPIDFEKISPSRVEITLKSSDIELRFDGTTGLLKRFVDLHSGLRVDASIDFVLYRTSKDSPGSGAYLFVPTGHEEVMTMPTQPSIRVLRGPLTEEVTVFTPLVNHTVRLFKDGRSPSASVQIENVVNLSNHSNLELVMRIRSNVSTPDRSFYTDSNCFQFINRTYYDKLPVQGNLYPMSCAAFLEGDCASCDPGIRSRLTLLSSYALGVTSPVSGELRVWLDRRAPRDDDRGLGQSLIGRWFGCSHFVLTIELVNRSSMDSLNWVPRLSLPTQFALHDLLRPVLRFSVDPSVARYMAPALNLFPPSTNIPCDYELINLKTFLTSVPSSVPIGLLLRRHPPFAASVSKPTVAKICQNLSGSAQLSVNSIFFPLGLHEAAPTRRITMVVEKDEQLRWNTLAVRRSMAARSAQWSKAKCTTDLPLLHESVDPVALHRMKQEYWRKKHGQHVMRRWHKVVLTILIVILAASFILMAILLMQLASIVHSMRHFFALVAQAKSNANASLSQTET
ncbi:unnamed protein product [Dicrocoelium dendriticum]|nr:unnamed protein product [Dicrocoelium dendriticum]